MYIDLSVIYFNIAGRGEIWGEKEINFIYCCTEFAGDSTEAHVRMAI